MNSIPWKTKSLEEVASITRGTEPGRDNYCESSVGVRFLRVGDITGKVDAPIFTNVIEYVSVEPSDVLLVLDGTPGYVGRGFKGVICSGIRKVNPLDQQTISTDWLYYCLQSPEVQSVIQRHSRGITIIHAASAVHHIKIPILPIKEQLRITRLLNYVEELRRLRSITIRHTTDLISATFYSMFGDPNSKFNGFDACPLSSVGQLDRGRSRHRPRDDPRLYGGPYPFIQTGDVANSNGLITHYSQTYSETGLEQSRLWPESTLCITIAANIAKTAILGFPACFPDSIVGFIPGSSVVTEYVRAWFESIQTKLEALAPQAAQKNINLKILSQLLIPIPPFNLQQNFADLVGVIRKLEIKQAESSRCIDNLFRSMLNKAFQGQL